MKTNHNSVDSISRERNILGHMKQVHAVARRVHARVPRSVRMDDLVSAGTVGLILAVDRFNAARGASFKTYAQHRILGAILDSLRGDDPLPRNERRRVRETESENSPTTVSLDQFSDHSFALATTAQATFVDSVDLDAARRNLMPRENYVVTQIFNLDRPASEVARTLHVNESRISQIKQRAIQKLCSTLTATPPARAA